MPSVRIVCVLVLFLAGETNNFIVGLTNVNVSVTRPTLWKYAVCGQYPGAVISGETVSVYCPSNLPPFQYVIIQLPVGIPAHLPICELAVLVRGTERFTYCIADVFVHLMDAI